MPRLNNFDTFENDFFSPCILKFYSFFLLHTLKNAVKTVFTRKLLHPKLKVKNSCVNFPTKICLVSHTICLWDFPNLFLTCLLCSRGYITVSIKKFLVALHHTMWKHARCRVILSAIVTGIASPLFRYIAVIFLSNPWK